MTDGPRAPSRPDPAPAPDRRGTLFVVATPIGNLEDITLRALRVLREVALVAAEDTRRTANLLQHYQIRTPLLSLHKHNEHRRADEVLRGLLDGRSIALVSDAGTPSVADPGALVVSKARAAGVRVEPIPGPSAVTAALSGSGLGDTGHTFLGFPPVNLTARRRWFAELPPAAAARAVVFFEAPHRLRRTLNELQKSLGDRPIVVARELTKVHEQWYAGSADDIYHLLPVTPKGEFVILVPPSPVEGTVHRVVSDQEIVSLFGQTTDMVAISRRKAIQAVAHKLGLSAKEVYAAIERRKKYVE